MNRKELVEAVEKIWFCSDEIGTELEEKFNKRQEEFEQKMAESVVSREDMGKPFTI